MTPSHGQQNNQTRYTWKLLRAGEFRLDGGSMFGLVPRSVWSRSVPADDRGRITVQHNCLLLTREGDTPNTEPRHVLIETGTGDKLDDKSRDLFAMSGRSITDALQEANIDPAHIGAVVISHLHFDHAGGLTRLARQGESPDWTGPASGMAGARPDHAVKRTFPNAKVFTQQLEWDDALANRSVMTRTYFADHLEPIKDQVVTIDSPRPFPPGHIPDRTELPKAPIADRCSPLPGVPGVEVFLCPGHTWGQQAVKFTDTAGQTVVFVPDVMPTVNHLGAAYSLAYDVEPYTSMNTRHWLLAAAAEHNWLLALDHEPGEALQRARPNGKGWFNLEPAS